MVVAVACSNASWLFAVVAVKNGGGQLARKPASDRPFAQLHDRPLTPMCVFSADEQQYKYVNVVMLNPPLLVGSPSP